MLVLSVIQGPDKGAKFELPDHEPQQIGRSSEALPLTDNTISRRQAELTPDEGQWYIRDLDSANGTFVNGNKIKAPTLLHAGDQIRCGATIMVFGRVSNVQTKPVRVLSSDRIDASVEAAIKSQDDSVLHATPHASDVARAHLRIIYDLTQLVGSIFDKGLLLERVMDLVFEHFEPDRGFMLIRESPDAKPEPVVVRYRQKPRSADDERINVSRTIVHHVMSRAEGVLSSNAMTDRRFGASESVQAFGVRSAICVPIKFRERVFGVIYIDSRVAGYTFTEDQLRLMTAIGAQTGLALENAELYQQGLQGARLAAVGETVASLSHSIRNILQAIRGGGEVVELGLRKSDINIVRNGWDILSRNLDRIYQLTMNMLAFSKQRKPEFEMVHVPALMKELIALVQPLCDKRGIALIADLDEDMPPIPADSGGLHQATMNLLSNAIDAVQPETGVITLNCHYDPTREMAVISVSDNGPGIPEETRNRLFMPFFSTKGQRGTGLGLAVTRKIIDEHSGSISVDTAPGHGATFTLRLSSTARRDPSETHA